MLSSIPTRRELLAWALAIVLAVTAIMLARPERAGAGASGPTTDVVYIATGENFPDALGAGPAAALGIGPILLVNQNSVPQATLNELNRLQPADIFIVGGTAVISDGVEATLEGLGFGPTVTRLAGENRFETAAAVSGALFPHEGFLGVNDKAADSDLLDGMDSSAFLMQSDVLANHSGGNQFGSLTTASASALRSVSLTAPVAGKVIVNSTINASQEVAGSGVECSITTGADVDPAFTQRWKSAGVDGSAAQLAGTRGFDVTAGQTLSVRLVCQRIGNDTLIFQDSAMTAIFVADT